MTKSAHTTSVAMSKGQTPKSPVIPPMPKTTSATRAVPGLLTTFTNEMRPGPRLGSMSVNPGKSGGK